MSTFQDGSEILQWNGPHYQDSNNILRHGGPYRINETASVPFDWARYWHKVNWGEVMRPKPFDILYGWDNEDCPHCDGTGQVSGSN